MSFPEIAKRFNRTDHTSAIHGVKMHAKKLAEEAELSTQPPSEGARL
jgi:chromosomal replication initiation ATPase DnaA